MAKDIVVCRSPQPLRGYELVTEYNENVVGEIERVSLKEKDAIRASESPELYRSALDEAIMRVKNRQKKTALGMASLW